MRVLTVIPARYLSTRLPGKPLRDIRGKPMIQWVYERASGVAETIVATDDERIVAAVEAFGGKCMMTSAAIATGTDRVAAVANQMDADIYVNVQGDEPLICSKAIECAVERVVSGGFPMATLMTRIHSRDEIFNPAVVKVIADSSGRAVGFYRIPPEDKQDECRRHIGIYVYTKDTLLKFSRLMPTENEKREKLEQLRAMDNGIPIGVAEIEMESIGVDTAEDLEKVRKALGAADGEA